MSLTHWLIVGLVLVLLFAPNKLPGLGKGIRESLSNFKKGLRGEEDIDVTHTVKRVESDQDQEKS